MEIKSKILKGDKYIWGAFFGLCLISILSMYSASGTLTYTSDDIYDPIIRHSKFLVGSVIVVFVVHYIHYKYLRLFGFPLFIISSLLLIWALFFGEKLNDASRWIIIPHTGIRIQPSELAKLGVIILSSYFLAKGQNEKGVSTNAFKKVLIIVGTSCLLIFTENFSTAALIGLVSYCMMIIAGVSFKKLGILLLFVMIFVGSILGTAYILDKKYPDSKGGFMKVMHRANEWNSRIASFFEKSDGKKSFEEDTNDDNYQEHHASMAIANSNGIGLGPGNSQERDFLPQAYSDFIYAIIIEEYGILGGLIVMGLYISILFRAYQNTRRCTQAFPAFLMMGIAMLIVFQAIINMMVATGVMPVTGQPLPMISRGGTSVMITGIYFGILLSISRYATIENNSNNSKDKEEIPESISAPNPNLKDDI